jgi:hypothetical protein
LSAAGNARRLSSSFPKVLVSGLTHVDNKGAKAVKRYLPRAGVHYRGIRMIRSAVGECPLVAYDCKCRGDPVAILRKRKAAPKGGLSI